MPATEPDLPAPPQALRGLWAVHCMAGLFFGVVASSVAAGAVLLFTGVGAETPLLGLGVVAGGGAVEGAVLGYAQWRILRDVFPDLGRGPWIGRTVLGNALGALLGAVPALLILLLTGAESGAVPAPALGAVLAVLTGACIGLAVGFAQAWVLEARVRHPWRWVLANLAGWSAAYACLALLAALAPPPPATPVMTLLLLGGPLVAGLCLGAVTAPALSGLVARRRLPLAGENS